MKENDNIQQGGQAFSLKTLGLTLCVSALIFGYALIAEHVTGKELSSKLNGLSDPALLFLLSAALTMAIGLNLAVNSQWTNRALLSVEKLLFDAYAFVASGFILASVLLAYQGSYKVALLSFVVPFGLFVVRAFIYWALDDFISTARGKAARVLLGCILIIVGPYLIIGYQLS